MPMRMALDGRAGRAADAPSRRLLAQVEADQFMRHRRGQPESSPARRRSFATSSCRRGSTWMPSTRSESEWGGGPASAAPISTSASDRKEAVRGHGVMLQENLTERERLSLRTPKLLPLARPASDRVPGCSDSTFRWCAVNPFHKTPRPACRGIDFRHTGGHPDPRGVGACRGLRDVLGGYGISFEIDHGNGWWHALMPIFLSNRGGSAGRSVKRCDPLGRAVIDGRSTGARICLRGPQSRTNRSIQPFLRARAHPCEDEDNHANIAHIKALRRHITPNLARSGGGIGGICGEGESGPEPSGSASGPICLGSHVMHVAMRLAASNEFPGPRLLSIRRAFSVWAGASWPP